MSKFIFKKFAFLLCLLSFLPLTLFAIEQLVPSIVAKYPHQSDCFTQGLAVIGNEIYESSGLYGASKLKKSHLQTGEIIQEFFLPNQYYAEGLAICKNRLVLLTWKEKKALVFEVHSLKLISEFTYSGEGWGLCCDGETFWMSDGTAQLYQRKAENFEIVKTISVKLGTQKFERLNDLVCVGNHIYANVWMMDIVLRIDKNNGEVTGIIDASQLLSPKQKACLSREAVLNGLAYRKETNTFFLTGKYWPTLFEVQFTAKRDHSSFVPLDRAELIPGSSSSSHE